MNFTDLPKAAQTRILDGITGDSRTLARVLASSRASRSFARDVNPAIYNEHTSRGKFVKLLNGFGYRAVVAEDGVVHLQKQVLSARNISGIVSFLRLHPVITCMLDYGDYSATSSLGTLTLSGETCTLSNGLLLKIYKKIYSIKSMLHRKLQTEVGIKIYINDIDIHHNGPCLKLVNEMNAKRQINVRVEVKDSENRDNDVYDGIADELRDNLKAANLKFYTDLRFVVFERVPGGHFVDEDGDRISRAVWDIIFDEKYVNL